jgi:hypothetical protein
VLPFGVLEGGNARYVMIAHGFGITVDVAVTLRSATGAPHVPAHAISHTGEVEVAQAKFAFAVSLVVDKPTAALLVVDMLLG